MTKKSRRSNRCAAAPELLAALELILNNSVGPLAFLMNRKELAGVARAAIAKAKGE